MKWQRYDGGESSFDVHGTDPQMDGVVLVQENRKTFGYFSTITYNGDTGLEKHAAEGSGGLTPQILADSRTITHTDIPRTDLASVPRALRWFVNSYGIHTPAALIHDRLIGEEKKGQLERITDAWADRYWRYMLEDLGVPLVRRWLMWAAVAIRTRYTSQRILFFIWLAASIVGTVSTSLSALTGQWGFVLLGMAAPLPFGLLWGRQIAAGWIAAYYAPFALPAATLNGISHLVYKLIEWVFNLFERLRRAVT